MTFHDQRSQYHVVIILMWPNHTNIQLLLAPSFCFYNIVYLNRCVYAKQTFPAFTAAIMFLYLLIRLY